MCQAAVRPMIAKRGRSQRAADRDQPPSRAHGRLLGDVLCCAGRRLLLIPAAGCMRKGLVDDDEFSEVWR